jgi:hypothetical protein
MSQETTLHTPTKKPATLPLSLPPRGLCSAETAVYVCVFPTLFDGPADLIVSRSPTLSLLSKRNES